MTFVNPLRKRWQAGQVVCTAWLMTADPLAAEVLAGGGFDAVVVDQQHGSAGIDRLLPLFLAIERRGVAPLTRVPANDAAAIGRSLDLGALGIIVPMVNSVEEAARAVAACRYGQTGIRSWAPIRAAVTMGVREPSAIEGGPVLILQIETTDALEAVDAIAATPGVDALLVGPADLGLSLGMAPYGGDRSAGDAACHAAALARVVEACERAGIVAGMYCSDGVSARAFVEQGFRMVNVATDMELLGSGGARELAFVRGVK
jgi:4-hydroxy-2-oxoheptanedioate aldolase